MKTLLAAAAVVFLTGCSSENDRKVALEKVYAASRAAEVAERKASRKESSPADAVNYSAALQALSEAERAAKKAGVPASDIEREVSDGRIDVLLEASRETSAANARLTKEINDRHGGTFDRLDEAIMADKEGKYSAAEKEAAWKRILERAAAGN